MNTFITCSRISRKNVTAIMIAWLVMAALSLFGLKVAPATCIYLEVMVLLCCGFCMFLVCRVRWVLEFQDDTLLLTNKANRRQYRVYDIPVSELVLTQNDRQRKSNTGDLMIQNTMFRIGEIENFTQMRDYIARHFPCSKP